MRRVAALLLGLIGMLAVVTVAEDQRLVHEQRCRDLLATSLSAEVHHTGVTPARLLDEYEAEC